MRKLVLLVTMLSALLTSCAHLSPSNQYPHNESYRVFGKTYKVLSSSKNYVEKGVASWYGRGFHKRRTTSGERYNMYKMTAAHKTLPFNTYVKVTNLRNGRQVLVRINDRGPFRGNRLIDLSYAAAKKLGMIGPDLVRVEVRSIS